MREYLFRCFVCLSSSRMGSGECKSECLLFAPHGTTHRETPAQTTNRVKEMELLHPAYSWNVRG